ncbi:DUF6478 family protein [Pontibaca salina]|uniref:Uncharacterized protein n=1 Tax=Pontibaca salina TaxID=2795731 RepID=A0A934M171_9RHOB|nr:DUF6478 family protein [Pontibaca salina]MBI6629366.1 hypothetical protein [Pontibaca salina]
MSRILDRLLHRGALRCWSRAAGSAHESSLGDLRRQRNKAHQLRAQLNRLIHVADGRLALPQIGSSHFPRPHGTDWSWRPAIWRGPLPIAGLASMDSKTMLGSELTLFHDCPLSELSLRQMRNSHATDLAPYGLRLDVFSFDGSYLSLVIDLPPDAANGLVKTQLIRVDATIQLEQPVKVFFRLNIDHGPNSAQVVRELPIGEPHICVEFDLFALRLNENRVEKLWLDIIFDAPEMNQIIIRDLTFARHPRAKI